MQYVPQATRIEELVAELKFTVGFGNHQTCSVFDGATSIVNGSYPHVLERLKQIRQWRENEKANY